MSDGHRIYAAQSPEDIIDLLQRGQGVFAIALDRVRDDLDRVAPPGRGAQAQACTLAAAEATREAVEPQARSRTPTRPTRCPSDVGRSFAHASERQFARLLDFYQIEWQYEPRSFDLECDRDGNVIQRFTPDFYLPVYDLYIEITTLNQKLVTRKNRKVRRLRELYPDVQCKVFYQRDYLSLVTKYGLDNTKAS